ncbi:MAG: hypothetical protein LBF23_01940 [Endomicrobium sp.]|nr:hypothetical protein [Endomicrobium sp.]
MPEITKTLAKSVKHAIFGYTGVNEEYFESIQMWFAKNFNFNIKFEWLVNTPGLIFAITMAIRALTKDKGSILIQPHVLRSF